MSLMTDWGSRASSAAVTAIADSRVSHSLRRAASQYLPLFEPVANGLYRVRGELTSSQDALNAQSLVPARAYEIALSTPRGGS